MSKTLPDQRARERITRELDRSFLVEAGAGSGKTSSLIDRMVALITSGQVEPEQMAAVTFTRKAAGELRERFQEGLEKALEVEKGVRAERASKGLEDIEKAFVGTIHSFCAMVLRERPVEAGLDPGFSEVDQEEDLQLQSRAWDRYLLFLQAEKQGLLESVDQLDIRAGELEKNFNQVTRFPEIELVTEKVPYPKNLLEKTRVEVYRYLEKMDRLIPRDEPSDGWDGLQQRIRMGLRWRDRFSLEGDRILIRLLRRMRSAPQVVLKRWESMELGREARSIEGDFRESIVIPTLNEWFRFCHRPAIEFLNGAEQFYNNLKRRENILNYQDLLLETVRLLRDNPEVRQYFQEKYTHLLVDEFQDTDPLQAEIVLYLAGEASEEKDWSSLKPRPGSLFVVGDPKQSIYRFRRADIDIYSRVRDQIKASGGEVVRLSTNFRSTKPLVEWANQSFQDLLGRANPPYQAEYAEMDYYHLPTSSGVNGVRVLPIEKIPYNPGDLICEMDAGRIAGYIKKAIEDRTFIQSRGREARPEDFLIIIPYKKNMAVYAGALEEAGIPFSMTGGGEIGSCRELVELIQVFKALVDPNNPVPLLAVLRGIYYGISDEELFQLKKLGGTFSFLAPLPEGMGKQVFHAWEQLQYFRKLSRQLSPATAMSRIAEELGAIPLALSAPLGRSRAGFILQAIEMVQKRERGGTADFSSNVDFLEQLLEDRIEEEFDPEGGLAGVRLMNLHKAKGLEAPAVFLANPVHDPSFAPELHVTRVGNAARGYLEVKDDRGTIALPPQWDYYQVEEEKYLEAEKMRLLYVAATRARDLLVVSIYKGNEKKSFWYPLNSYLAGAEEIGEESLSFSGVSGKTRLNPSEREQFYRNRDLQKEKVIGAEYSRETVTEFAATGKYPARKEEAGRGPAWGNVIHQALEKSTPEKILPDQVLLQLIKNEGLEENQLELVRHQLKKVMESSLWARVKIAEEVIREANFGLREKGLYLTGSADLVFKEDGEWVIVDYKSDLVEDEEHLQELIGYYRPQVETYCSYWEKLTGEKVKELGLLFTDVPTYFSWEKGGGGEG